MRRFLSYILLLVIILSPLLSFVPSVQAQSSLYNLPPLTDPPIFCGLAETSSCPTEVLSIYANIPGETCASGYADFLSSPTKKHYWVEDPAITNQGKADERARQFMYWVLNTNVIDEAPVLRTIWTISSTVALFGIVLIAAIFGIGYIISQRTNYDFKIQIQPSVIKIGLMLLYTVLSAALIFILIQFSEVIMQFFYENLGGKDLFNIYFVNPGNANLLGGTEDSYTQFVGCRDLNIRVQEAANTELFMLKLTNVSYYVLGTMLLLRKILLWFLLFVSPFLALLMPFILIRNTGWIWIGVFFQWLFYGPLVALFLGAMSKIWAEGIPFSFDFSRAGKTIGYIYPTAINIVYGGPGQRLGVADTPIGAGNNGNYIDTFAEYIITLIMLWAVTFFPWWLLRIFRDYCCDGIYAMKNILMRLYDHMRNPTPPGGPNAPHIPTMPTLKMDTNIPMAANVNVALGSMAQMRKSMTSEIVKNMNMKVTNLSDIARVETNKQLNQTVNQHLAYLANPVKAQQSNQRQQYMQLRSELFNRTIKKDTVARTILASTSTSASERAQIHKSLMQSMPQAASMSQIMTQVTSVPTENVSHITNTYITNIVNNASIVKSIAQQAGVSEQNVTAILKSYTLQQSKPIANIVTSIAQATNTNQKEVTTVLQQANNISNQSRIMTMVTSRQKVSKDVVSRILNSIKTIIKSSASHTSSLAQQMHTDEKTITSIVSFAYESVSKDSTQLQRVAQNSSTDTSLVQKVLSSYVQHISEPHESLISTVSAQTHVSQSNVEHIMNQASQVIQSSPVVETLAKTHNLTKEQIITVITPPVNVSVNTEASMQYTPAIQILTKSDFATTQTGDVTTSSQQTVQNVFNTITNNKSMISSIAAASSATNENVSRVISAFAQNASSSVRNIAQSVAYATNLKESEVTTILQNTSSAITKSQEVTQSLATGAHVDISKVQEIARAIPQVIAATSVSTDQFILSQMRKPTDITQQHVESILSSITRNESILQHVATQANTEISTVTKVLNAMTSNVSNAPQTYISELEQNNVTHEQTTAITWALAQTLKDTSISQSIADQSHIDTSVVSALGDTINTSAGTIHTIVTNISNAPSVSNNAQSKSIMQSFANHITEHPAQILKLITQETNQDISSITNVLQNISSTLSANTNEVNSIAMQSGVSTTQITSVLKALPQIVTESKKSETSVAEQVINKVNGKQSTTENITTMLQALSTNEQIINAIATETTSDKSQITQAIQTFISHINDPYTKIVEVITQETNITKDQSVKLFQSLAQTLESSPDIQQSIATQSHTSIQTVQHLAQGISLMTQQTTSVSSAVASDSNIDAPTSNKILKSLIQNSVHNESFVQNLAKETNLKEQQITNALTTYAQNIDKPQETIVATINQAAGIAKPDIPAIFVAFANNITNTDDIIAQVAKQENVSEDQVVKLMDTQVELASEPEKHIEKTITIPQSISLEDYEEVKEMWIKHYEESEVPVSDSIKTRHDWLDHEIVYITNTLNKIMSQDEKLQQEGLDELGFLLPIFLINSLSGEELLVYLKAKLEAAKTVLKVLDSKESVRKEMTEDEEEEILVDVKRENTQEVKQPMHMELDEDTP